MQTKSRSYKDINLFHDIHPHSTHHKHKHKRKSTKHNNNNNINNNKHCCYIIPNKLSKIIRNTITHSVSHYNSNYNCIDKKSFYVDFFKFIPI